MYSICNKDSKYSVNHIYEGYSCKKGTIAWTIAPHKKGGVLSPRLKMINLALWQYDALVG
jgi:hypothetical protein